MTLNLGEDIPLGLQCPFQATQHPWDGLLFCAVEIYKDKYLMQSLCVNYVINSFGSLLSLAQAL